MVKYTALQLVGGGIGQLTQGEMVGPAQTGTKRSSYKVPVGVSLVAGDTIVMNAMNLASEGPVGQHLLWIDNFAGSAAVAATVVKVGFSGFAVTSDAVKGQSDAAGLPLLYMNPTLDGDYINAVPPVSPGDSFFAAAQTIAAAVGARTAYQLYNALPIKQGWSAAPQIIITIVSGTIAAGAEFLLELNTVKL